jgi:peroxiredoxin
MPTERRQTMEIPKKVPWATCAVALAVLGLAAGGLAGRAAAEDPKPGDAPKEGEKKEEPPKALEFTAKDVDGKDRKLSEFAGKWVVLEWTNYGCPHVKRHYDRDHMQALQRKYTGKGVVWLTVCSHAPGKKGHLTPEEWKKALAEKKAAPTALLVDADGTVGRLFGATRTPEIRIVDPKGVVAYSGAIDDKKEGDADPATAKNFVVTVLDAGLEGKPAPIATSEPYG